MKHIKIQTTILLGLIILNSSKVIGQCTSGVSWCTVGIPINTTDVFGGDNSNTNPLYIQTNGTTRVTIAGNSNNIGIGTITPTAIIGINGNSARTIQMERHTTSNTAGNSLTVLSGGATIGATNKEGGLLLLSSGTSTGTGDSKIQLLTATGGTTGTSDRTPTLKMIIVGNGNVGIGSGFNLPKSRLHINQGGSDDCRLQMTNATTTATDENQGFRIAVLNSSMNVELRQQENADMLFWTNATTTGTGERMRIKNDGKVGIGTSSPTTQLHVATSTNLISVFGANSMAGGASDEVIGVRGVSTGGSAYRNFGGQFNASGASTLNSGVNAYAEGSTSVTNTGGSFRAVNAFNNYGMIGFGGTAPTTTIPTGCSIGGTFVAGVGSTTNYGSYSSIGTPPAFLTTSNVGGYFYSTGDTNSVSVYAVYATVTNGCTASTSVNCKKLAGYFNGAIVTTLGSFTTSDAQFKTNVQDVQNALQVIEQLQPKTYDFDPSYLDKINLPEGNHYGFIAGDVALVLPGTVKEVVHPETIDTLGNVTPAINYSALNYDELIPILTAAIKELKAEVDILQSGAKSAASGSANQLELKLADKSIVVLEQNLPNPWKENTTINFNIPDDIKQAQILFYNSKGNVISTVEITEKGAGSLLVYGTDLTNGVYTYTLLIDGKPYETKKMMKIK